LIGSIHGGRIIAKRAVEHLKPVALGLGGKAPLIILKDADPDEAVKAAAFGAADQFRDMPYQRPYCA
jgi:benzaldehyde dehydrogenase (NAD)